MPMKSQMKSPLLSRAMSRADDELHHFRYCLQYTCMDQSSTWRAAVSWSIFLVLAIAVPIISHFVLSYEEHRRPYDSVVQLSLSAASSLGFVCLSGWLRKYGLRRFLYLDRIGCESERVRLGYVHDLNSSFRFLSFFVLPCFFAECGYKVWWYLAGARRIPFLGNEVASDVVACVLELASWIYRFGIFFLVCILFRLICHLQILRLQDFTTAFQEESDVAAVLRDHLKIRRQLTVISHRFRKFILTGLVLVTASQFAALFLATGPYAVVNLFNTGELALCSIGLVTGLLICLRSGAKITHKAQAVTKQAAKWHVCATIDSFNDPETPEGVLASSCVFPAGNGETEDEYNDDEGDDEDEYEATKLVHPHASTISFQKRQALVTYLENNQAGITLFGFVMDRSHLHIVFMIELSLFLWLLGKTIGIS